MKLKIKKLKTKKWFLLLLILPALIIYSGIAVFPIFNSMVFSFYSGPGLFPDQFVGVRNYITLFTEFPYIDRILNAFWNTIKFFIVTTLFTNFAGFIIALLVRRKFHGAVFFRRLTYIPVLISILIVGSIFKLLLSPSVGIINDLLRLIKLEFLIRPWLADEQITLYVIAMISSWQFIGIPIVLYSAGIDGINKEILEAANIDGANEIQKIKNVIIPLMMPVFRLVMILNFIGTFTGFAIIYATVGPAARPNFSSDIFGTLFYRAAFGTSASGGWGTGMGASVAAVVFVILFIGTLIWMRIFRNRVDY